ncbi:MAG: PQQ-binding-like beta-propeller repeat protein [Pirellulaceae bacterium]|nr:PQQ-binding-like beta-propeller repeat protein [Pirellulaceae bacterium]
MIISRGSFVTCVLALALSSGVSGWGAMKAWADDVRHRILCADSSKGRIAIIGEAGQTEWEKKIGPLHDLHLLSNGNVLMQTSWTELVEVKPSTNEIVWQYNSAKQNGNAGKKVEVHAFQRLENGLTMIAESGPCRIIEVDAEGKIQHALPLKVTKPHPHRDTRLVRKLASGNYLVCHEGDGLVREYAADGSTIWEYAVPLFDKSPAGGHGVEAWGNQCYCALRLASGNTLISTGNGHGIIEVTPDKQIVWHVKQDDLPGIQLAWVTTLQVLPSGNIVLGNCHAGEKNPQVIEITRDKQVVWKFHDFDRFGDAFTNTQVLSINGASLVSRAGSER